MFSNDQPLIANQLPISADFAVDNPELLRDTLTSLYKRTAQAVNTKEGALYVPQEVSTFQQYFKSGNPQAFRPVYRLVVDFGALPNAGTKTASTGIPVTADFRTTRLYGSATNPSVECIPIPHVSTTASNGVHLSLFNSGGTWFVRVITAIDYSAFTACTIVLEYTKIS